MKSDLALMHLVILAGTLGILGDQPLSAKAPDVSSQLIAGKLQQAEELLSNYILKEKDDMARFQLGTVQFARAVERLSQDGARYGVLSRSFSLPFLRVGGLGGKNAQPEPVTYEDVREMLKRFQVGVEQAEATLSEIRDPNLKWQVNLREFCLDFDGDKLIGNHETLEVLFCMVSGRPLSRDNPIVVSFDSADVHWLRGYLHVLMAFADMVLAYDQQELFDRTGHLYFREPKTEFSAKRDYRQLESPRSMEDIYDVIAVIHLINFPLREKNRLTSARDHLLSMIQMSRQSWELIEQESDNGNEWIPGPNQQSVIPNMQINEERLRSWRHFLDEGEAVLNGHKLIPFWRSSFEGGINLARVFTEPQDFDLVLWIQGTDALPYLEEGEISAPETWMEFQRIFGGRFLGFAGWIN